MARGPMGGGRRGGGGGQFGSDIPDALPFDKGERLKTLRHLGKLFAQMWRTSPWLMVLSIGMRLVVAVQPPLVLLFTKLIIDEVVKQSGMGVPGPELADWLDSGRLNFLMLLLGAGNGYVAILMFTWMQTNTPKAMLGRMMSMVMLAGSGLVPISQALSGAVIKWSLETLFVVAGLLIVLVAVWVARQPGLHIFSAGLSAEKQTIATD